MKRILTLAALFLICFQPAQPLNGSPQRDSPRSPQIASLARKVRAGDKRAVRLFWDKLKSEGTPLIEPVPNDVDHQLVTFLWRDSTSVRNVLLVSGLSNESYGRNVL